MSIPGSTGYFTPPNPLTASLSTAHPPTASLTTSSSATLKTNEVFGKFMKQMEEQVERARDRGNKTAISNRNISLYSLGAILLVAAIVASPVPGLGIAFGAIALSLMVIATVSAVHNCMTFNQTGMKPTALASLPQHLIDMKEHKKEGAVQQWQNRDPVDFMKELLRDVEAAKDCDSITPQQYAHFKSLYDSAFAQMNKRYTHTNYENISTPAGFPKTESEIVGEKFAKKCTDIFWTFAAPINPMSYYRGAKFVATETPVAYQKVKEWAQTQF